MTRAVVVLATAAGLAAFVGSRVLVPGTLVDAPPFYGQWRPAIGPLLVAPITVAVGVLWAARRRYEVPWTWVLVASVAAALAWSASLAVADHIGRLTAELHARPDFVHGLGPIGSHPGHYLATFDVQARGPAEAVIARGYPTHVQGHPPGAVLTLWALTRLGFGGISGGIALVWSGQAAAVVGVLLSVRRLAGDLVARAAAPFVVLLPAAVWSHSYDSYFAGIGALAVTAAVFALVPGPPHRADDRPHRSLAWAVTSGVLFGYLALLSYGLVLLALGPVLIALQRRYLRPLLATGVAAAATIALPAAWGFNWFGGLATTHHQYVTTIAEIRPYSYFVWDDLVIAACALGPAVVAGFLIRRSRRPDTPATRWLGTTPLVLGGLGALLTADLSGMAKAEVERIFQPFFVWIAPAAVAIAAPVATVRRDRVETVALSLQAAVAIVLTTQLSSPW